MIFLYRVIDMYIIKGQFFARILEQLGDAEIYLCVNPGYYNQNQTSPT